MTAHTTWQAAHAQAQESADVLKRDIGIKRVMEYGHVRFVTFILPAPQYRTGRETTCEIVNPRGPDDWDDR